MSIKLKYLILILPILIIGLVISCKKKTTLPEDLHSEYFGIYKGRYVIYDVIEINHDIDATKKHDTLHYQLKTKIGQDFIDNEGRSAKEFIRFKRNIQNDPWQEIDLWTTIINGNKAELVEENQRMIKLIFSPTIYKTWNANAYNIGDALNCSYSAVHVPYKIDNTIFDSTLVVNQQSYYTLVDCKRKFEVYASKVGLVYKYYKDLRINNFDTLDVEKGKELYYKCVGYGFE